MELILEALARLKEKLGFVEIGEDQVGGKVGGGHFLLADSLTRWRVDSVLVHPTTLLRE